MLIGDLNINTLRDSSDILDFKYLMFPHHYVPLILKPTFFSENSAFEPSCLDHIWINKVSQCVSGILEYDFTDHCPVFLRVPRHSAKESDSNECVKVSFRDKSEGNMARFRSKLSTVDWSEFESEDVDIYLEDFILKINSLYCECFPLQTRFVSKKRVVNAWMTPRLLKIIELKSKFFKLLKLKIVTKSENKMFRNRANSILRTSKNIFYQNLFKANSNSTKKTWDLINRITSRNCQRYSLRKLIYNSAEFSDDDGIAQAFYEYFVNIGKNLSDNLEGNDINPINSVTIDPFSIFLAPVTIGECSDIVRNLKLTVQGRDVLPVNLLIKFRVYLIPTLIKIINKSLSNGKFPAMLKNATVIPVFKCGDNSQPVNYRPITLLPTFSEIFDKCIYIRYICFFLGTQLYHHLNLDSKQKSQL